MLSSRKASQETSLSGIHVEAHSEELWMKPVDESTYRTHIVRCLSMCYKLRRHIKVALSYVIAIVLISNFIHNFLKVIQLTNDLFAS